MPKLSLGMWIPAFLFIPAAYAVTLLGVALAGRFPGARSQVIGMEEESKFSRRLLRFARNDIKGNINDSPRYVPVRLRLLAAVAWAVMHISWGAGFLARIIFGRKIA
ncbi:MAG: hypothetical protein QHH14_13795 [Clostridiales bacterium]|nr:hypothetical protein [Clostridiales bacterium]